MKEYLAGYVSWQRRGIGSLRRYSSLPKRSSGSNMAVVSHPLLHNCLCFVFAGAEC